MAEGTCPIGVIPKASWLDGALQNREEDRNNAGREKPQSMSDRAARRPAWWGLDSRESHWVVGPGICCWAPGRQQEGEGGRPRAPGSGEEEADSLRTILVPH